jgi:hypothetical protein
VEPGFCIGEVLHSIVMQRYGDDWCDPVMERYRIVIYRTAMNCIGKVRYRIVLYWHGDAKV